MGGGPQYFSNHDQKVGPGGIVDIGVEMRAPTQPGEYVAHWTMISDTGKTFGGDFTVFIKVVK
jgi:methionine-rich copper-binding protein CopC